MMAEYSVSQRIDQHQVRKKKRDARQGSSEKHGDDAFELVQGSLEWRHTRQQSFLRLALNGTEGIIK
jgi:hypothetical protein